MNALVVQHLVTLNEATKIMRLFKQKKHADKGYFFELQDLGGPMTAAVLLPGLEPQRQVPHTSSSWWHENAYVLRVYWEVPDR